MTFRVRERPLWWVFGPSIATMTVVLFILVSRWAPVRASNPAYLSTVLLAGAVAVSGGLWSLLSSAEDAPRSRSRAWTVIRRIAGVGITIGVLGILLWLRPLPATPVAAASMASGAGVNIVTSSTVIALRPDHIARTTGLIFYPGALVDPRAYVPLLRRIARAGYPVDIVKAPYNIAFLATGAPSALTASDHSVTHWVIGGHSLGGVVAARYAATQSHHMAGLVLWASYPSSSMRTATWLHVSSISASNDGLATPAKIHASKPLLPPSTTYVEIAGAVHSDFGDYGPQRGDGTPTISRADAQAQIVRATKALLDEVATNGT